MNSVVRPIFNESVVKKRNLWILWIVHETHWKSLQAIETGLKKKKKKSKNADIAFIISIQMDTKCVFGGCLPLLGLDILIGSSI